MFNYHETFVCVSVTGKACSLNFSDDNSRLDFDKRGSCVRPFSDFLNTSTNSCETGESFVFRRHVPNFLSFINDNQPVQRKTSVNRNHSGRPAAITLSVFSTTFFQRSNRTIVVLGCRIRPRFDFSVPIIHVTVPRWLQKHTFVVHNHWRAVKTVSFFCRRQVSAICQCCASIILSVFRLSHGRRCPQTFRCFPVISPDDFYRLLFRAFAIELTALKFVLVRYCQFSVSNGSFVDFSLLSRVTDLVSRPLHTTSVAWMDTVCLNTWGLGTRMVFVHRQQQQQHGLTIKSVQCCFSHSERETKSELMKFSA